MRNYKQKVIRVFISLSLLIACVFGPVLQASAVNNINWLQYNNKTYQVKNWATGHNLNMWVTDASYLYNGTPVTMYGCYLNDNTQWFKVQKYSLTYNSSNQVTTAECAISSIYTNYALNIGYRVAGSTAVMYDRNLDLETWIIQSSGQNGSHNKIVLKSNPSLCLAENPYTQQVYLEPIGASNCQDWNFIKID